MDAYAFVLEALRENDCRRLRAYVPDGKTKFTTWLVVVTRRLALDHVRRRYGRPRSDDDAQRAEHATRRRLEDLVAEELDPDQIVGASDSPDESVRRAELTSAVRSALAALEPADQLLLALRYEDERPVKDIARALGLPSVFHVYRRLGAVLDQMRRALARRGVEEAEA
jgi:RNA polymerase sigma factor (sigma-70 family)